MTKLKQTDKIFVALDNMLLPEAERVIKKYEGKVYGFKINHSLLHSLAPYKDLNIFVDLKLWDIPNTVVSIVEHVLELGATYTTISTLNSPEVFKQLEQYKREINLLGVTYLTSWSGKEQYEIMREMPTGMWRRHIKKIVNSGFAGIICSPHDIETIEHTDFKHELLRICPGIRTKPTNDDQKRTATPTEAFEKGADYLVMGRSFFNA